MEIDKKLRIFEAVLSEMTELVFVGDANENILYVNKAFQTFTGYKAEEIAGRSFASLFEGENQKRVMEHYAITLKGKRSEYEVYFSNTGILCECKNMPLKDEKNYIIGVIGIARNVTEYKRINKEIGLLNELQYQFSGNHSKALAKISEELQTEIVQHIRQEEERKNKINGLRSLIDFSNLMNNEVLEAEIIKHAALFLKHHFKPDILSVLMLNNERNNLDVSAVIPAMPFDKLARKELLLNPLLCNVIRTGQAFLVKDIDKDIPCDCLSCKVETGGYVCLPLIVDGNVIGVAQMINKERNYWNNPEKYRFLSDYLGIMSNAIHRVRTFDTYKHEATTDMATGMFSRRFFYNTVDKLLSLAKRHKEPLSILFVDIDHFKHINDTYGEAAGDIVLQQMVKNIANSIRKSDFLCRYGGKEFAIILPKTDMTSAIEKAEKIRKYIGMTELNNVIAEKSIKLTISIGVASFPEHGTEVDALVTTADNALYKAKQNGRNRVETP